MSSAAGRLSPCVRWLPQLSDLRLLILEGYAARLAYTSNGVKLDKLPESSHPHHAAFPSPTLLELARDWTCGQQRP